MGNIGEIVGSGRKCMDCRYPCVHNGGDLKPVTADELRSEGFILCDDYRVMPGTRCHGVKGCMECIYPCVHNGNSALKPVTVDELRSQGFVLCDDYTENE